MKRKQKTMILHQIVWWKKMLKTQTIRTILCQRSIFHWASPLTQTSTSCWIQNLWIHPMWIPKAGTLFTTVSHQCHRLCTRTVFCQLSVRVTVTKVWKREHPQVILICACQILLLGHLTLFLLKMTRDLVIIQWYLSLVLMFLQQQMIAIIISRAVMKRRNRTRQVHGIQNEALNAWITRI